MAPAYPLPNIYDLDDAEIRRRLRGLELPDWRLKQIRSWLDQGVISAQAMTNLSLELRGELEKRFAFKTLELDRVLRSSEDGTAKYAFRLNDGQIIETVAMSYRYGRSVCVSSQVGCRMSCRFCASTLNGRLRNLSSAEMLAQVTEVARLENVRVRSLVVMGIGEPLENMEALLPFLRAAHRPEGPGISYRRMTVSSCGLVPEIRRFAEADLPITLAISLHAPNQKLRERLMPIAKACPLTQLMPACAAYQKRSGRRLTFEYLLIRDVNDTERHARELAALLRGLLCHVNLIPFNRFGDTPFERSRAESMRRFQEILEASHIACTMRRSLGNDIMAACGQLRRHVEEDG